MIFDIKLRNTSKIVPIFGSSTNGFQNSIFSVTPLGAVGKSPINISIHYYQGITNYTANTASSYSATTYPFDTWFQIGLTADVSDYVIRVWVNKQVVQNFPCNGKDSTCSLKSGNLTLTLFGVCK